MNHIKGSIKFDTNYNFRVFRGDQLIQEENTHNVITNDALWNKKYLNGSYSYCVFGNQLKVGNGTGTPAATDTALFNTVWTIGAESINIIKVDDITNTITTRWVYTMPATSAYVGTITECGLWGYFNNQFLYTHALIKDAEGNAISINKTDLDKVIITVDISITISSEDPDILVCPISKSPFTNWMNVDSQSKNASFYPFNCCSFSINYDKTNICHLIMSPVELMHRQTALQHLNVNQYGANVHSAEGLLANPANTIIESDNVRRCTGRISQAAYAPGHVAYVKGLMFLGTFIVPFPNERFLPAYNIEGIDVGVAVGGETEMLCPLDYFVKDSDKVYKNGVALTRGVDYTVDAYNNHRALIELAESNDAIITGGLNTGFYINRTYCRLFRPKLSYTSSASYTSYIYDICGISTDSPLYLDMQKDATVNFLRVPINSNYKYTISTSEDGIEYTEHATHTFTSDGSYIWEFEPITARYFKLEIASASGGSVTHKPEVAYTSVEHPEYFYAMGFKTDGMIKFTSTLEAGDIITMDCSMDLPYKTENNVIDYDFSLSL